MIVMVVRLLERPEIGWDFEKLVGLRVQSIELLRFVRTIVGHLKVEVLSNVMMKRQDAG